MAYIEERKRQKGFVYRANIRLKGYPVQNASFDRKSDAMRWAEETEHALLHNLPLPGEELPLADKSIADAVSKTIWLTQRQFRSDPGTP